MYPNGSFAVRIHFLDNCINVNIFIANIIATNGHSCMFSADYDFE